MKPNPSQQQETTDPEESNQLTLVGEIVETDSAENTPTPGQKLHRIINKYGFDGLGDWLERKYNPPKPRATLRELQEKVNKKVLDQHMRGASISESDFEDCLHHLTSDDRELTADRLNELGSDGEEVLSGMVSHGTVQNYLLTYRDIEKQSHRMDRPYETADSIARVERRIELIVQSRIEAHSERGEVPGVLEEDVRLNVICPDGDKSVRAADYLEFKQCPKCIDVPVSISDQNADDSETQSPADALTY